MRLISTVILVCVLVLGSSGCDKEVASTNGETSGQAQGSTSENQTGDPTGSETSAEAESDKGAGDDCVQAYADLEALIAGLEEQLGPSDAGMPDRDDFIARCRTLPSEIQRCMVFEHGMANKDACEKLVDGLDPDQRAKAEELMGK